MRALKFTQVVLSSEREGMLLVHRKNSSRQAATVARLILCRKQGGWNPQQYKKYAEAYCVGIWRQAGGAWSENVRVASETNELVISALIIAHVSLSVAESRRLIGSCSYLISQGMLVVF